MLPPKNSTVTLRLKRHPFPNLCNIVTVLSVGGLGQCLSPCSSFPSVPHQSDSNNNKWHNTTICWCVFFDAAFTPVTITAVAGPFTFPVVVLVVLWLLWNKVCDSKPCPPLTPLPTTHCLTLFPNNTKTTTLKWLFWRETHNKGRRRGQTTKYHSPILPK